MPTIEEYKSLAKDSNFANIDVWGENADRYFDNADEMIRWIDQPSLVPFLKQIDDLKMFRTFLKIENPVDFQYEKDRKIFRDKVVKMMLERTQNEAGKCFETFRRINIFAGK